MFNVSCRSKSSMKDRMAELEKLDIKSCPDCGQQAVQGKFVEPVHALVIDWAPPADELASGAILSEKRTNGLKSVFGLSKPPVDFGKLSYTYVCKSGKNPCLTHLSREIEIFDPILIIGIDEKVLPVITGRTDLEVGKFYVTGRESQYLFASLIHPRAALADKQNVMPIWNKQLSMVAAMGTKYALNVLK